MATLYRCTKCKSRSWTRNTIIKYTKCKGIIEEIKLNSLHEWKNFIIIKKLDRNSMTLTIKHYEEKKQIERQLQEDLYGYFIYIYHQKKYIDDKIIKKLRGTHGKKNS